MRSSSMVVASRNPINDGKNASPPTRRNNNNNNFSRHNSIENLTPVKPGQHKYQGARRARDLEQHLKDKYGLPDNAQHQLRRANSHSSLTQFSPMQLRTQTLTRRKSHGVLNIIEPEPKSLKTLTAHPHEPRDSKLRYLGRMSPEEQVDKYLKSMEKEAKLRQQQKHEYRTIYDPNRVGQRVNTSISSRWHSLDSVSRPALARGVVNNIINNRLQNHNNHQPLPPTKKPVSRLVNAKPVLPLPPKENEVMSNVKARERTDIPKSFASMPQIVRSRPGQGSPTRPLSKSPEEKMSTGSDQTKSSSPNNNIHMDAEDDYADSCSCTDVTLDETLKINHNHRKSLAKKRQLQTQRLKELQKAEEHHHQPENGIKVSYLGSITLDSKSSDLLALQKPLKSLYFKYVIARQAGLDTVPGNIEITPTGLKVSHFVCLL